LPKKGFHPARRQLCARWKTIAVACCTPNCQGFTQFDRFE